MITICEWGKKELEIGSKLDEDKELEFTILDKRNDVGEAFSVWLNVEQVNLLIQNLQNVLKTN